MDNFYNLSKYIRLRHLHKLRICRYWANEIYYLHRDKYDLYYDPDERKKYNWIYLKRSLLKIDYVEDDNIMYYVDNKHKIIIKIMNKTVVHRSYPFYNTATKREIVSNYFIKSIANVFNRYSLHIIYVDTDDMIKVSVAACDFVFGHDIYKGKPMQEY